MSADTDSTLAVFLDLENIALGAQEAQFPAFEVRTVIESVVPELVGSVAELGQLLRGWAHSGVTR